jgi:hypothetical protein
LPFWLKDSLTFRAFRAILASKKIVGLISLGFFVGTIAAIDPCAIAHKAQGKRESNKALDARKGKAKVMEKNAKNVLKNNTGFAITGTVGSMASLRPGHVEGARNPRKTTIIGLYRDGSIAPALAVKYGAKMADHVEAVKHGVKIEDIIAAGVDMRRMESSRVQQMGRDVAKAEKLEKAAELAKPKTMMMVRKANGQSVVLKSGAVKSVAQGTATPTAQQVAVAVAVVMARKMEKAKAAAVYDRNHGIAVKLTPQEQEALLARNQAKGSLPEIK